MNLDFDSVPYLASNPSPKLTDSNILKITSPPSTQSLQMLSSSPVMIKRSASFKVIGRLKEKLRISEMEHAKDRLEIKTLTRRLRELEERLNKIENAGQF